MKIIHSAPASGSSRLLVAEAVPWLALASLSKRSGQAPLNHRRRRFKPQSVSCSASPRALIRLSISDFSVINGGANWMVSPP